MVHLIAYGAVAKETEHVAFTVCIESAKVSEWKIVECEGEDEIKPEVRKNEAG